MKTEVSEKPLPLDDYMIDDLLLWYSVTPYKEPDHYIFATDSNRAGSKRGKQPWWPNKVMDYWTKPAAMRVGITSPSAGIPSATLSRTCSEPTAKTLKRCRSYCGIPQRK